MIRVSLSVETEYSTRYIVEGELKTPDGRTPHVKNRVDCRT